MPAVLEAITKFITVIKALGYADNTVAGYARNLQRFKRYLGERSIHDLKAVSPQVILEYQQTIGSESIAPETKAMRLRPIKRLFKHLVDTHRLLINPTDGVIVSVRKSRKIGPVLTIEEMKILLHQPDQALATGMRNRAIMEVLYSTAIRLTELMSLDIHDTDLKERVLYIRKGKGRKERVVPMGKTAVKHLGSYLQSIRPGLVKTRSHETILFVNRFGGPLSKSSVHAFIRKYRFGAGIEKPVSPHTFRRTCATHLLQQGADIRYIQKLLGHKRLGTTQAYTRVMPIEVKQTHERTHPRP